MNYIDFSILLIAVVGALYGLIKGVLRQLGSLGGFVAGVIVSRLFGESFGRLLQEMFDLPVGVSRIIAYSLLFLVVYIVSVQLMRLIHHISRQVALGWLDRLAGALFGAVKYWVILSIVLNLVHIIDPKGKLIPEQVISASRFYGYTMQAAPTLFSIAQETLVSTTKLSSGLFIPYSMDEDYSLYCENRKVDKK